jgi:hypothetical protein
MEWLVLYLPASHLFFELGADITTSDTLRIFPPPPASLDPRLFNRALPPTTRKWRP